MNRGLGKTLGRWPGFFGPIDDVLDKFLAPQPTSMPGRHPIELNNPAFANEAFVSVIGLVAAPEGQQRAIGGGDLCGGGVEKGGPAHQPPPSPSRAPTPCS